jgi:hypothetical protein
MSSRNDALDILIEDLALQLLSSDGAADQAAVLEERLEDALETKTASAARKKTGAAGRLEIQRVLSGMAGRAGSRAQETRSLVRTLEWNLRYYIALREAERATGAKKTAKPPARRKR